MEIWKKYKVWFILAGILLLIGVFVLIYFAVLKQGQSQGVKKVLADIPNPANDAPLTETERRQIADITNRLESVMSGFWWSSLWSDTTPFEDLNVASTRVMIGVYQQYKVDRPNSDLIADIESLNSLNYNFSQMRIDLIAKLKNAMGL